MKRLVLPLAAVVLLAGAVMGAWAKISGDLDLAWANFDLEDDDCWGLEL